MDIHWDYFCSGKPRAGNWSALVSMVFSKYTSLFKSGLPEVGSYGFWGLCNYNPQKDRHLLLQVITSKSTFGKRPREIPPTEEVLKPIKIAKTSARGTVSSQRQEGKRGGSQVTKVKKPKVVVPPPRAAQEVKIPNNGETVGPRKRKPKQFTDGSVLY